jgi:uncharacterized ion transporter superfamily protein YfcC
MIRQNAANHVKGHVVSGMAQMRRIVHRRPTDVIAHIASIIWNKVYQTRICEKKSQVSTVKQRREKDQNKKKEKKEQQKPSRNNWTRIPKASELSTFSPV